MYGQRRGIIKMFIHCYTIARFKLNRKVCMFTIRHIYMVWNVHGSAIQNS